MRPQPILILVLAASGLLLRAPGVDEAFRFEFAMAVVAGFGVLAVLRGLDVGLGGVLWDANGERRLWITLSGAGVIILCLGLASWSMRTRVEFEHARHARAQLDTQPSALPYSLTASR